MREVSERELVAVTGERIRVPDSEHLVHLQFRRFAGCPICNVHLRSIVQRHDEITAAGIREVVFFHSPAAELRSYDLPFAVIGDPGKRYYREFGVESSLRALLHPRTWGAILRGSALTLMGKYRPPAAAQAGGRLGLPADFLIAPGGRVHAAKYGAHAYDQWSVDELLGHARAATSR
ncbi:AhpC/TSA family protein [Saccharopolyspora sp. K220]|uniref:peroxiredoxin-like family protein n=1 Tax=Saccharopolyspora soli TaxID=2926618 RepID=UPI001F56D19B|nr:peroxiredoxin-like family protein [Saccharopolyspora soli]MCI2415923.1 AhpC/TSA family protein [Saccharopolyspora soli]